MWRYACRRAGAQVADDVASQTFVVAFDRRRTFRDGVCDARPWLLGIATNLLRRHRRTQLGRLRAHAAAPLDRARGMADDALDRASAVEAAIRCRTDAKPLNSAVSSANKTDTTAAS